MKKLIFGSGKVASIIQDEDSMIIPRTQCDITNSDKVCEIINRENPDVVINCAAISNLEKCEEDKMHSYNVNTMGAINLLTCCSNQKIKYVHISSGCLFDGNQVPRDEQAEPDPKVWYTRTKMWADDFIINYGYENYLILRPRQMITKKVHPTNMITKFVKMDRIAAIEEANSVTCIEDFALMMQHLININATGIYNCANEGTLTPHDIALAIKENIKPSLEVSTATYEEFLSGLVNKRVNTILDIEKLKSTGFNPRPASDALTWCVTNYGK